MQIDFERQKAETASVKSSGLAIAEAKSKAEADQIYYQNLLERA
jgi:hypothetical protein